MTASWLDYWAAGLFALAVLHTFSASYFHGLSHRFPSHAGLFHLLGEVEVVFGFWALILVLGLAFANGASQAVAYLESRNYAEPLFVFAIMVVAASKPILHGVTSIVNTMSSILHRTLKLPMSLVNFFLLLSAVPLLGSFITEPAAMTLAALLLSRQVFSQTQHAGFKYATLGVLFVNVSVGGALTSFAAPPILMVASAWSWDTATVFELLGTRAILVVVLNALALTIFWRHHIPALKVSKPESMPWIVQLVHGLFLLGVVVFAHHPVVFLSLLLFFMGYTQAYNRCQQPLMLKEALLVAFFLAGLVVLGGLQQWWLQPLLVRLDAGWVYFGATALTAMTDNAALTYLGSLVEGTTDAFKYALVAGAISGGGLTVIANAPNPAGLAILRDHFPDQGVSAWSLFKAAILPTGMAIIAFYFL